MKLSPLQLEFYFVRELSYSVSNKTLENLIPRFSNSLHAIAEAPKDSQLSFSVSHSGAPKPDDLHRWRFELTVVSKEDEKTTFPYKFKISLVGFFNFLQDPTTEKAQNLIKTNSLSMLFSMTREMLAQATSRGPFPAVILPAVSFVDEIPAGQGTSTKKPSLKKKKQK